MRSVQLLPLIDIFQRKIQEVKIVFFLFWFALMNIVNMQSGDRENVFPSLWPREADNMSLWLL